MEGDDALQPAQEATLIFALCDAYVQPLHLGLMLARKLNKPLDTIPDNGDKPSRITRVVAKAKSEGWVWDLIRGAAEDRPKNQDLVALASSADPIRGPEDPPSAQRTLDTAYFDLHDLRSEVADAVGKTKERLLAFGITYAEGTFVGRLRDWLASYLGQTQVKENLNLKPNLCTVPVRLRQVASYRAELNARNVLCVVDSEGAPADMIAEFWTGICRDFGGIPRYLVLIFTGTHGMIFPHGVIVLPEPMFRTSDVDLWTHEMVRLRRWPMDLADAWTDRLCRHARWDDDTLDVRLLYEAMEQTIEEVRFDPKTFRQQLEEASRHADATPA